LKSAGIGEPRRNAEILLEHVLNIDRNALILSIDQLLHQDHVEQYEKFLIRHENGEPVQYITGSAPFFGYSFIVGKGVFVPRFDSEALVERALNVIGSEFTVSENVKVLDLCCGCGTIGLAIAAERKNTIVTLTDNSPIAVDYTRKNAVTLGVSDRTDVLEMNALNPFPDEWTNRFHIATVNPPYIPAEQISTLPIDVREGDPLDALTDDGEGFSFYRRFMETVPPVLKSDGHLFVECADEGAETVSQIMSRRFMDLRITRDLNGINRVVEGRLY